MKMNIDEINKEIKWLMLHENDFSERELYDMIDKLVEERESLR